jgi:demethylmenaquinone methyltransferase/2-methoxy-6-polyprenyl-1,4-benzoquinol methylase
MDQPTVVKPYNQGKGKKAEVEQMFDNIANRYDFLNRLLSLGIDVAWRRRAIGYLRGQTGMHLLDVATGTADVALVMAKTLSPAKIIGIDISHQMLDFGRQKVAAANLEGVIHLQTADCEHLPFADAAFDAVTVAFGVRNFEHLEKGLTEMLRVLKPGGKIVILEFSKPRVFPVKQLYHAYFKFVLPLIGRLSSRDVRAYAYLFESVQAFPEGQDFTRILEKTGYRQPTIERLTFGICSIYSATKA